VVGVLKVLTMYVVRNQQNRHCTYKCYIEARSYKHCCSGKVISIISVVLYCECVFVCSLSYPACKAHVSYCYLWPALLYSFLPHYLKHGTIFEKGNVTEHKMCVLIIFTNLSQYISHSKKN